MCNLTRNWYRSRSSFHQLTFLQFFDLLSGKRSCDLQCSIFLYSLFEPSVCSRSTFCREILCCLRMTVVNFMYCFYSSAVCALAHKADEVPCNGDSDILRVVYLRGRSLLCVTGYAVGRICFCCGDSWLYTFSTLCIGSKFQQCVCKRGVGVFCPMEPLSATLPAVRGPGPSGKVWAMLVISVYFKRGVHKVCSYRVLLEA